MSTTIAVAGKGGTGKTIVSAVLAKLLTRKGTVLAIDADPSMNLYMALGMDMPDSIGDIRESLTATSQTSTRPAGMGLHDYISFSVRQTLVESPSLDLMAMGRPEGPGCYCAANHALRVAIDHIADSYDYVVIDNEAGMEHISRQTTRDVDILLLVSDPTIRGVTAAGRAQELLREIRTQVGQIYLVLNRVQGAIPPAVEKEILARGLSLLAVIPSDDSVRELDSRGRPMVELPPDSPVQRMVRKLAHELGLVTLDEPIEAVSPSASLRKGAEKP
ncbi:MAG: ATP-binding protein [Dehalococcoidia bacterium]|nr:ATP-binding protein [Dehalococcoidia bacterium]